MKKTLPILGAFIILSACATASKFTIENRLQELGLSSKNASCMAKELDERLDDQELSEFAQFTVDLTRSNSSLGVIDTLSGVDNPKIARAVAVSGLACVIAR
ncbi:MAG: hypothetical protein AAF603_04320 [Pseudomonadota bacterium]